MTWVTPSGCVGDAQRVSNASCVPIVTRWSHDDNKGFAMAVLSDLCYLQR